MRNEAVIETIGQALQRQPDVKALFLSGSFATGHADAFSDIDFVLVSETGASDEMAALWRSVVEGLGEIVLWRDRQVAPALINAIMSDWTRLDVVMLTPDQLRHQTQDRLRPVFDRGGLYEALQVKAPETAPSPGKFLYDVEEFIRILGLLHLAIGRQEYINGVLGVFLLRNLLVDLMIEETAEPVRGGILHLNRLITVSQKEALHALPPPSAERDALIDAYLAYASAYFPRARNRATALGVDWPERFEEATWARLNASLGIERPYSAA